MFWLFRWVASRAAQNWDLVTWAAGTLWTLFGGTMTGWAAFIANPFPAYAPLSWVVAGLIGAAFSAFIFWLVARSQHWLARAKWTRTFSSPGDGVNPMDDNFIRKRIKINDFVSPAHAVIQGKTFDRCELFGPSTVMFGNGAMVGPQMYDCNFICIKNGVTIHNAIQFDQCSLINCKVYRCNVLVSENDVNSVPPVPWLSRTPTEFNFPVPWNGGMALSPPTSVPADAPLVPKPASERSFPPSL